MTKTSGVILFSTKHEKIFKWQAVAEPNNAFEASVAKKYFRRVMGLLQVG